MHIYILTSREQIFHLKKTILWIKLSDFGTILLTELVQSKHFYHDFGSVRASVSSCR